MRVFFNFKNKNMVIAGVWVNENNKPTKKQLQEQALKSVKYQNFTKDEAIRLIDLEITASGYYRTRGNRRERGNTQTSVGGSSGSTVQSYVGNSKGEGRR